MGQKYFFAYLCNICMILRLIRILDFIAYVIWMISVSFTIFGQLLWWRVKVSRMATVENGFLGLKWDYFADLSLHTISNPILANISRPNWLLILNRDWLLKMDFLSSLQRWPFLNNIQWDEIYFWWFENEKISIIQIENSIIVAVEFLYCRGDSMIWDFTGRRPLPARDDVVSIEGGPKLWNHVSKVWRLPVWRN